MFDLHERGFDDAQPCLQLCRGIKVAADLLNPSLWSREQSVNPPSRTLGRGALFHIQQRLHHPIASPNKCPRGIKPRDQTSRAVAAGGGRAPAEPPKATRFGVFLSLERNLLGQSEERVECAS